jgi:hypothetical protein
MFSKESSYKSTNGGYRKYVYAAVGATAAMLGGAALFGDVQTEGDFKSDLQLNLVNFYSDHHDYHVNLSKNIDSLKIEGETRYQDTIQALLDITELKDKGVIKNKALPGIQNAAKQQDGNVKFGDKTVANTVEPKKITESFGKSAEFIAEVKEVFPKDYVTLQSLRQNLKDHHFDLGTQIKDVEMMSTTTKDNIDRPVRKLNLRKKYKERNNGKVPPNKDAMIWKYEIRQMEGSIKKQLAKIKIVLKNLDVIQKGCDATAEKIKILLISMKKALTKRIEDKKYNITQEQEKLKTIKCPWWEAIFTLGIACGKYASQRNAIRNMVRGMEREVEVAKRINKRFNYFDHLTNNAKELT